MSIPNISIYIYKEIQKFCRKCYETRNDSSVKKNTASKLKLSQRNWSQILRITTSENMAKEITHFLNKKVSF